MVSVHIDSSQIKDLARDYGRVESAASPRVDRAVEGVAKDGNRIAQSFARQSAGAHGKHYPAAFDVEQLGIASYEYGPDSSMLQGNMSFEYGSRNQPPHLDLTKSADMIGAQLSRKVGDVVDDLLRGV